MWQSILEKLDTILSQISAGLVYLASIVGALGLVLNLINFVRNLLLDKRRLRILIGFERKTGLGSSLTFTVINSGRRAIVIEHAVLVTTSGQEIQIHGQEFPANLDENNPKVVFHFYINHPNYSRSFTKSTKLKYFKVVDAHGKVWKFPSCWPPQQKAWRRENGFLAKALEEKREHE